MVSFGQGGGNTESHDERDRQGAGPQSSFLSSAEREGLERRALVGPATHDQRSDAERTVNLVRTHADKVYPLGPKWLHVLAKSLRRVDMEVGTMPAQGRRGAGI